jgi:hypothetical protein
MNLTLTRHAYLPDVTLGKLRAGELELATLEEPWVANPHGPGGARHIDGRESCVPDGKYDLVAHSGAKFKNVWCLVNHVLGVFHWPDEIMPIAKWGRACVLIHTGNTTDDIIGCILIGMMHSVLDGKPAVLRSGDAMTLLRAALVAGGPHTLTIRPTPGTGDSA